MSENITWIDASGISYDLNNGITRIVEAEGISGINTPSYGLIEAEQGLYPGTRVTGVRTKARDIDVPVILRQSSRELLFEDIALLSAALDPNRGDGQLRYVYPDGTVKDIYCRCINGLGGTDKGFAYREMTLTFRASDPYWYDTTPVEYEITEITGRKTPWFPIFPLRLCSPTIFSEDNIVNSGQVVSWPVWEITGPGSEIKIQNATLEKAMTFDVSLSPGDKLYIDTRPGHKSIKVNNIYRFDILGGELWPLLPGDNVVKLHIRYPNHDTVFNLTYYNRYL